MHYRIDRHESHCFKIARSADCAAKTVRHRVIAGVCIAVLGSTIFAAPTLCQDVQRAGESGSARLIQAIRSAALMRALDEESKSNKYGTFTSVSFPLAVCVFERGLCGALNRDGSIAVHPQFDWVGSFHEGRALVRSGGLYGYVDSAGRLVVEPQYALAGDYWHGLAEVDVSGKSALIDLEGRMVLEPKFARALPFSTDAFWVKDGTRRPFYQGGFDELVTNYGKALNTHFVVDGNWMLIDRAGTRVPTPNISSIRYFDPSDGKLMWARTDAGWGLIRPNGTWPVPPKFEQLGGFAGERAAVRLGGKWGYIDRAGTMVIAPMFEEARLFGGNDLAPVRVAGRWGYIDRAGTIIVQPQYDDARSFDSNGLATAKLDGLSGLIDKSGAWLINPKFQKVWHDRKDVVFVRSDGKLGVYERSGRLIAAPQFSQTPTVCDDGWILGFADDNHESPETRGSRCLYHKAGF